MHIANPIYDVIFKYMLEDNKVAKIFLSAIIGEKIEELDFSAQEQTVEIELPDKDKPSFTVCRFDFSAKVKTEKGFKTIRIELQKAKFQTDLMRFRRYLGVQYQKSDNIYLVAKPPRGKKKIEQSPPEMIEKPREIYCIYFLAYGMDLPELPVIMVDYKVKDAHSKTEIPVTSEFISGLHHRSWIVQINQLKKHRRDDLEKLLSVFDQSSITDHRHILSVDDKIIPKAYQEIIRRLRQAMEDPKKRREMELEDDILNELKDLERQVEEAKKEATDAKKEATDAKQTIVELQSDNEAKENTIVEQENTIAKQEKEIADLKRRLSGI